MGLCKCPKKKVSNLFCFSHRVTVCESCLVLNHRKCVIRSYLEWLKDSDYDATCQLCGTNLEDEECIRLICYDLFHKKCLSERQLQLPKTTSPNGHACPKCNLSIFPPQNLVSPVADSLRIWLSQMSWGRNELMNLTTSYPEVPSSSTPNGNENYNEEAIHRNVPEKVFRPESPHSILNIESRPLLARNSVSLGADRDDNKYKRRTPQEIFFKFKRQFFNSPASRSPLKRKWFLTLFGFSIFFVVIYLMYHFGRADSDSDINSIHYEE